MINDLGRSRQISLTYFNTELLLAARSHLVPDPLAVGFEWKMENCFFEGLMGMRNDRFRGEWKGASHRCQDFVELSKIFESTSRQDHDPPPD